jgi:hypothetical protein
MLIPGKNDPSEPVVPLLVDLASMRRGATGAARHLAALTPCLGGREQDATRPITRRRSSDDGIRDLHRI